MKRTVRLLFPIALTFFLLSCALKTTLKYQWNGIETMPREISYGNLAGTFRHCTLSSFLIKTEIKDSTAIVWIRSGMNPEKTDFRMYKAKAAFVNICDTLYGTTQNQLQGRNSFLYVKRDKLYLRFHTRLCPQEMTIQMIPEFWKKQENKAIWNNWEENNL